MDGFYRAVATLRQKEAVPSSDFKLNFDLWNEMLSMHT